MMAHKVAFITGITGQDGSYLAELLLAQDYRVHGLVRRASSSNTARIQHLIDAGSERDGSLTLHHGDMTDTTALTRLVETIRPDELYNAAAVAAGIVALRARFRLSLIDGPVLANCGALLTRVDAVLLVVDSARTSPQKVRRALNDAAIAPTGITGVVLNRAPHRLPSWTGGD